MEVKIKKLDERAIIPTYAKDGDAGLDLTFISRTVDVEGNVVYGTGLAFEIPKGYVGLVFPRSSISKKDLYLTNAVGVIDAGYRGEITAKFKAGISYIEEENPRFGVFSKPRMYEVGERGCQMIILPYPHIDFVLADELSDTERGKGGYGSTGK
jgi:dUTP pyrophosphatase